MDPACVRKHVCLPGADYSSPRNYFVTICAKDKRCIFGSVRNGAMELTVIGTHVQRAWHEIPVHCTAVELDEFVVMPNHVHGIIRIIEGNARPALATVVATFKAAVTRTAKSSVWQRGYYEHIIRSRNELNHTRAYIAENPVCWERDPEFTSSR